MPTVGVKKDILCKALGRDYSKFLSLKCSSTTMITYFDLVIICKGNNDTH